jgi:hypothetical protein
MEVLLMPAPCICAADGSGQHPIEIGFERTGHLQVRSIRTPCDFAEADAIDRLGQPTCVGAINDVRDVLAGKTLLRTITAARGEMPNIDRVTAAAQHAEDVRRRRRSRHTADPLTSPIRLVRTQWLLAPRLPRLWNGPPVDDVRVNFGLSAPQVQVSFQDRQAVFEFMRAAVRRRPPGWRLRQAPSTYSASTDWYAFEAVIDRLLPSRIVAAAMRGLA